MSNKKIVSGVFWSFSERIVAQLVSFVVSIVLARMLMPEDYGEIAILLIFISIADVFVSNGFGTALIQDKNADKNDFSTIFYCSLSVSLIIYIVLFFSAPLISSFYNKESLTIFMRVLALRIPISSYNTIQRAYISRNMMFQKFFYVTLIGTVISAIVGIAMAYNGFGAWSLIAQYLTNTVIDSISLTFIVDWRPELVFVPKRAKELMSFGGKVLAAELIGTTFDQIQSFVISKVFSPADLAYYNKGNQIPNMISSNINNSVMTVLFPAIANNNDDYCEVKKLTKKSIRVMAYVVFPLMIGLSLVSKEVIIILLTDKWATSISLMSILSIAVLFSLVGNTGLQTMKAVGRSDILLKIEAIKKPVLLLCLSIGVQFGVMGVAISYCLYNVYAMIINFGVMGKIIGYNITEQVTDILDIFKISIIMGASVFCINFLKIESNFVNLIIKVIVGISVYLIASLLFKSTELKYFLNIIKKDV